MIVLLPPAPFGLGGCMPVNGKFFACSCLVPFACNRDLFRLFPFLSVFRCYSCFYSVFFGGAVSLLLANSITDNRKIKRGWSNAAQPPCNAKRKKRHLTRFLSCCLIIAPLAALMPLGAKFGKNNYPLKWVLSFRPASTLRPRLLVMLRLFAIGSAACCMPCKLS